MFLLSTMGCYSIHPPKHFYCARLGILTLLYPSVQIVPQNALMGTNLDCMVASPVGRCYCLPQNPDKLGLHVAGHCLAVQSANVAA